MDLQVHRGLPAPEELAALVVALGLAARGPGDARPGDGPAMPRWAAPSWARGSWSGLAPSTRPHVPGGP